MTFTLFFFKKAFTLSFLGLVFFLFYLLISIHTVFSVYIPTLCVHVYRDIQPFISKFTQLKYVFLLQVYTHFYKKE